MICGVYIIQLTADYDWNLALGIGCYGTKPVVQSVDVLVMC